MQCNIDERGQKVRMSIGVVCVAIGIVVALAALGLNWSPWAYLPAGLFLLGGTFSIFEARKKWCAARAMGFRTPV